MLRLSCAFCAHRNPEGSAFCNHCGSPLHLAPCTRCEAINNLRDDWCHACGSPLDDAQAPDAAAHEPAQVADAAGAVAALPALDAYVASTSSAEIWDPQTPHELNDEQQDEVAAYQADDPPAPVRYPPGAHYGTQTTRWSQRIALGLAFAATAGGVYWSTLETAPAGSPVTRAGIPASAPDATSTSGSAPASVAPPQASSAALPEPAAGATTTPAAEAPAQPSDAVTTVAPTAVAPPPVPPAAPTGSARTERAPDETAPAQASVRPPPPETRPRATATARTREQAARDALATRRLIERDLGVATGAESAAPTRTPR